MKKIIISLFLIVSLISGCNRLTDSVSHAPKSQNAPEPTFTTIPTPTSTTELKGTAPSLSDNAVPSSRFSWHDNPATWYEYLPVINIRNLFIKYVVNIGLRAVALAGVSYGVYKLYEYVRPANFYCMPFTLDTVDLTPEQAIPQGYQGWYWNRLVDGTYRDWKTHKPIKETPVFNIRDNVGVKYKYLYKPESYLQFFYRQVVEKTRNS